MSCYILPAASTFVNVAAVYQPVVFGNCLHLLVSVVTAAVAPVASVAESVK